MSEGLGTKKNKTKKQVNYQHVITVSSKANHSDKYEILKDICGCSDMFGVSKHYASPSAEN